MTRRPRGGVLALLYHDVHRDGTSPYGRLGASATRYHVPLSAFRRQLDLVAASGLRALTLAELRARLESPGGDDAPAVFLCFDDGWRGSIELAGPELAARGLPATLFVTTGFLGRPLFADADLLRAAHAPAYAIGAHGVTHRMLSSLPPAEIVEEARGAKATLESILGAPVDSFSIPGGAGGPAVVAAARAAGYALVFDSAIAVNPTRRGRWGLARVGVDRFTTDETFARWLRFDLRREALRKAALGIPKAVLGMRTYSRLRRALLGERGGEGAHVFDP